MDKRLWHRYGYLLWVTVAVWLIGGLLLWAAMLVNAYAGVTFTGNAANCQSIARIAVNIAEYRELEIPWEQISTDLDEAIAVAIKNPKSYIKTDDDAAAARVLFKQAYEHPNGADTAQVSEIAFAHCMTYGKTI